MFDTEKVIGRDIRLGDYICGYSGEWTKPGLVMDINITHGLTIDRFEIMHDSYYPNPNLYAHDKFTRLTDNAKKQWEVTLIQFP